MNIEQIKKNAPADAQKYLLDVDNEVYYFKFDGFDVYQYSDEWFWVDNIENNPNYYDGLMEL